MSKCIVELVNSIPDIENKSYLELGVWDGRHFNQIKAKHKVSVDITWNPTYKMTTDEFFAKNKDRFDIIFIDADHRIKCVYRDYMNSIKWCDEYLFIHDLIPPAEEFACENGDWAGDGYKLLMHWILNKANNIYTLNYNSGLTLVRPPFVPAPWPLDTPNIVTPNGPTTPFAMFRKVCADYKCLTLDEMKNVLRSNL